MPVGTTFQAVMGKARVHAGLSDRVGDSVDHIPLLQELVRSKQRELYDEYDWPHLRVWASKSLSAGQRYYDMPTSPDLDLERIEKVTCRYNSSYHPVVRGIDFDEHSAYDPVADSRSDPVLNWDIAHPSSSPQLEVWPLPATATTLYFKGIKALGALVENSDTLDLDDEMVAMFVAAELLAERDNKRASLKLAQAEKRKNLLRSRWASGDKKLRLGLGSDHVRKPHQAIVRVS